jgi:UDP-glucose 4-epimerase
MSVLTDRRGTILRMAATDQTWLLTGGAGYIGGHVLSAMRRAGYSVVVLDDLSTGSRRRVPADVPFVHASILDADAIVDSIHTHRVTGVVHLAAKKSVPESLERPLDYWRENVGGTERLLRAMNQTGVERIVYSSSAAVYGTPDVPVVTEDSPTRPESPYGQTKLASEWMLAAAAHRSSLRWITLRYFNVAGAASPELADTGATNLIPQVLAAVMEGRRPQVFGGDYPTRDGSCIRDFIHVADLADVHVAAVHALESGSTVGPIFNVGCGQGYSVKEVMDTIRRVVNRRIEYDVVNRRAGDPAQVIAASDLVRGQLGWKAQHGLEDMVRSAWQATFPLHRR